MINNSISEIKEIAVNEQTLFDLEKLFRQVIRMMRSDIHKLMDVKISFNEISVLLILKHYGPQKASMLSKYQHVSASQITSITNNLVKKKLVGREKSTTDRRVVELRLTEEGMRLIKEVEKIKSQYLQTKFSSFSNNEIQLFMKLLHKLTD